MFIPRESPAGERTIDWASRFRAMAEQARHPDLCQFYRQGAINRKTPIGQVPMLAMDFETTGLDARQHSIISIGVVQFDMQRIYCRTAKHWLIKPNTPLVDSSVQYHGITHSDINNQPDLLNVLPALLHMMAGRVVVVHYRAIERNFLDAALRARIHEGIGFPVIDTLELEARRHRGTVPIWQRLRGHKPASIRLADSRLRYNLPHYAAHHALTDAIATAELLQAQLQTHFSPTTAVSDLWW